MAVESTEADIRRTSIEYTLVALTDLARRDRSNPLVYQFARRVTDPHAAVGDKVRAIVDETRRRFTAGVRSPVDEWTWAPSRILSEASMPVLDADDVCSLVAALMMSVGIRCCIVGARYGHSWTCWVAYEVVDHWDTVDPLRQRERAGREPDEVVWGPVPDVLAKSLMTK